MRVYNPVPLAIGAEAGWKPYRTVTFGKWRVTRSIFTSIKEILDTLKLYSKAHGSKVGSA
jgi:hypothetical protein